MCVHTHRMIFSIICCFMVSLTGEQKVLGRNTDREAVQQITTKRDRIFADLRRLQERRDTCSEERREVDAQIRLVNQTIGKKVSAS